MMEDRKTWSPARTVARRYLDRPPILNLTGADNDNMAARSVCSSRCCGQRSALAFRALDLALKEYAV